MCFSLRASRAPVKQVVERVTLIEALKNFEPFERLGDDDLVLLATRSQLETTGKGAKLFGVGDEHPWMFCLRCRETP